MESIRAREKETHCPRHSPIVHGLAHGLFHHLTLAHRRHADLLLVLLQAADDVGIAWLLVPTERLDLINAGRLHREVEVDVLRHEYLLVGQHSPAHLAQCLAVILQALENAGRALHQPEANPLRFCV
jgi:hypothetical protein